MSNATLFSGEGGRNAITTLHIEFLMSRPRCCNIYGVRFVICILAVKRNKTSVEAPLWLPHKKVVANNNKIIFPDFLKNPVKLDILRIK